MLNLLKSGIKKIISPATIFRYYKEEKFTRVKKWFSNSLVFFKPIPVKGNETGILLVQMVRDHSFTIKLAAASKLLADKHKLKVEFYDVTIHWTQKMRNLEAFFDFFNISVKKVYLSFGSRVGFKNDDKYKDQKLIIAKLSEITSYLQDNGVEGLLKLKFDDVEVGDLIYDSYLRFYSKPTIEEINADILLTIEIALNIFYNFKDYLRSNDVKCLVTTYVSYIYHGIVARICLSENITVYTLGYNSYLIQELKNDFPYHQINHTEFSPNAILSHNQIELAKNRFTSRFAGKIDSATSYMRASAYSDVSVSEELRSLFKVRKRNVVIYAHDFYDSPHINRKLLFPDFYQYLKQTLNAATQVNDTTVFIKTHPNGMPGSKEKLIELVESFNKEYFIILDESVSNHNIIELRPDLVCTSRGTIGMEMAYFKIPTIALFDNIYANFNFVHTCLDTETYFAILKGEKEPEIDYNEENIYKFYYQAYLNKIVKEDSNIFTTVQNFKGATYSDDFLTYLKQTEYLNSRDQLLRYYSDALLNIN